jgi:hypothetical protein
MHLFFRDSEFEVVVLLPDGCDSTILQPIPNDETNFHLGIGTLLRHRSSTFNQAVENHQTWLGPISRNGASVHVHTILFLKPNTVNIRPSVLISHVTVDTEHKGATKT